MYTVKTIDDPSKEVNFNNPEELYVCLSYLINGFNPTSCSELEESFYRGWIEPISQFQDICFFEEFVRIWKSKQGKAQFENGPWHIGLFCNKPFQFKKIIETFQIPWSQFNPISWMVHWLNVDVSSQDFIEMTALLLSMPKVMPSSFIGGWLSDLAFHFHNHAKAGKTKTTSKEAFNGVLCILKEKGVLEKTDAEGWGLLHHYVFIDEGKWISYLLKQGLDPLLKNSEGLTPLELLKVVYKSQSLLKSIQPINEDLVRLLEEYELKTKLPLAPNSSSNPTRL